MAKTAQALRYHEFGNPADVLRLDTIELPDLGPDDVLVRALAASINPADFGSIGGSYGKLQKLPATAGLEGVGEIVELGANVSNFQVGQWVFLHGGSGAWQTYDVVPAAKLFPAPQNLPLETAAMGWVNPPTAWKLLKEFADLKAGDWIAQNAATSAVGKLVIQFAARFGIRTINLVRNLDAAERLKELGADVVLLDDKDAAKAALAATKGRKARLAFNSVGGNSVYSLCKLVEDHGTIVTFGGMDRELSPFPTRYLIFNDLRLRGLWATKWYETASRQEIRDLHQELFTMMASAKIAIDVAATYPLGQFKEAIAHANKGGKTGKVLFRMDG